VNKTLVTVLGIFAAVILLAGAFSGGFLAGHFVPGTGQLPALSQLIPGGVQGPTSEQQTSTPSDVQALFKPFWEAWNIVHDQYVDQPVDDTALMQGAIKGMMEALGDKQTFYMDPKLYENQTTQLQGSYEGIGAYVDLRGDYLTIVSPIEGSPAEAAGLKPGDKVIAIDGEDMTGVPPEEARSKIIGPDGTQVTLTVSREGQTKPLEFTITRAKIVMHSAEGKMLENENKIGYIDINTFGDQTTKELRDSLDKLLAQNPRGLIIDLRNNPGGYLTTAVEVSSEFIEKGPILYEKFGNGKLQEHDALGNGRALDIPIVVLVNEGSASASEILTGALQDYGRAKVVGVQSYGKGSVQVWQPLSNNQGAARVTIAKWLTPDKRAIDHVGLTPDVIVEMTEEDYTANRDPQLDAAIETLNAVIGNTAIPTSMPTSIPAFTPTPAVP
jgi:carboxyl-terminal processing protease